MLVENENNKNEAFSIGDTVIVSAPQVIQPVVLPPLPSFG